MYFYMLFLSSISVLWYAFYNRIKYTKFVGVVGTLCFLTYHFFLKRKAMDEKIKLKEEQERFKVHKFA